MNIKFAVLFAFPVILVPLVCGAQSALPVPQLLSPANSARVYLSQIRSEGLLWEAVPNATRYEIEVTGPSSFNGGFPYTTSMTTTTFVFGQGDALDTAYTGTYYWRVKAVFGGPEGGNESEFSERWSFVVSTTPSPTPTPKMTPTPRLDLNDDGIADYLDLFEFSYTWSSSQEQRDDLSGYVPHFQQRNITPTPTPTPLLSTPSSLRVILNDQPVPQGETIPSDQVGSIILDWEDVIGTPPITYDISIIGPKPQASISYSALSQSQIRPYSGYQGLYPGKYTWSVQAIDSAGHRSSVSTSVFTLEVGEPPAQVVDPSKEPDYDLDANGIYEGKDLFRLSTLWGINKGHTDYTPRADYNRDNVVDVQDAASMVKTLPSPQLFATHFTTIDIYNPPQGSTPATFNRTINADPNMALRVFEMAYSEIHFDPVNGAIDYEVTLTGLTSQNWPVGHRFRTGGQLSVTFMLSGGFTPTTPGSYHLSIRAIDPKGIPGKRSTELNIALSY
ncbi:MAG: hypothetical protein ABIH23_33225 [bacterium]